MNVNVDELNDACLQRLSDQFKIYLNIDTAIDDFQSQNDSISKKYLNIITFFDMSRHLIAIKIDCFIILLCNFDFTNELCNDTRLIVTAFSEWIIETKILSDIHQ